MFIPFLLFSDIIGLTNMFERVVVMKKQIYLILVLIVCLCFTACGIEKKVVPAETEEATLEQGIKSVEESEYENAIVILTKVIEKEPENADAYVYRGDAYMYAAQDMMEETNQKSEQAEPDTAKQEDTSTAETEGQDSEVSDDKIDEYLNQAEDDYSKGEEYNYKDLDYIKHQVEKLLEMMTQFHERRKGGDAKAQEKAIQAMDTMEYAIVVSSLWEMGCSDVSWDVLDADGDGRRELYMTAYADDTYRQSQLLADISGPYMTAHVATGAAGSSEYITIAGFDSYIMQDGYYTVGNTQVNYYEWNGSVWEEVQPATGDAAYAEFLNPDLTCTWIDLAFEQAISAIHPTLTGRENYMNDFHADMDGDGVEEYVYFYQGAANRWFGRLKSDSNMGSEYYLNYRDNTMTAIVASWDAGRGQTCLRVANFGEAYGLDVVVDGNIMTFNGEAYAYQKESTPFLYQGAYEEDVQTSDEVAVGTEIDLGYAVFTMPEEWNGRVTVINNGMSVEIYEVNDYALGGGGHIRTIGLSDQYESDHPARNLYASVEADGAVYFLYTLEPTDVPYIDMNNVAAGMTISEQIDMQFLMDHIRAKDGYKLDWFIG